MCPSKCAYALSQAHTYTDEISAERICTTGSSRCSAPGKACERDSRSECSSGASVVSEQVNLFELLSLPVVNAQTYSLRVGEQR